MSTSNSKEININRKGARISTINPQFHLNCTKSVISSQQCLKEVQPPTIPLGKSFSRTNLSSTHFTGRTLMEMPHKKLANQKLIDVEGECRIESCLFLEFSWLKTILLGFPLILSLVGLLFLKYSIQLRVQVFYKKTIEKGQQTHVYIIDADEGEQIVEVYSKACRDKEKRVFQFKQLTYELRQNSWEPLGLDYINQLSSYRNSHFSHTGLDNEEIHERTLIYGLNEHNVQIPSYWQYLFDTMTQPFFILQYISSVIYIFENVAVFAASMIFFSTLTTTINYVLLYFSYMKPKEIAQKSIPVKIRRNGVIIDASSKDIVPGDLYQPYEEIPCDSLVFSGQMFVNEVGMTGQNVPIGKFELLDEHQIASTEHWVYQGSSLLLIKPNSWLLAINTGFASTKGRILRKILTRVAKTPDTVNTLIIFILEAFLLGCILFGATFYLLLTIEIEPIMIVFRFLDFATYSVPASFPIYFNLAYSCCLVRLRDRNILGTEPEKTIAGSRLDTICFDKTGTLTQTSVRVSKSIAIFNQNECKQVNPFQDGFQDLHYIFAACHTVKLINGILMGDEVDLQMFLHSKYKVQPSESAICLLTLGDQSIQVLRINQYESRFQSMSVIARNRKTNKLYVLAKGAPELIHSYSTVKFTSFKNKIKELSLQGFRSIGLGLKQISQGELRHYMSASRKQFLAGIRIVGIVAFENSLKSETKESIQSIKRIGIASKVVTGDNIYVAVQMAMESGIVQSDQKVIVLEGKAFAHEEQKAQKYEAVCLMKHAGKIEDSTIVIDKLEDLMQQKLTNVMQNKYCFAIDDEFFKGFSEYFPLEKIKIFARISPKSKALIVKRHKEAIQTVYRARSCSQRVFGDCRRKVAMVGDGANDLIAIREADLGIGINNSDAVYAASFTIQNLLQILDIIRQGRNTEQQIIQIVQYVGMTSFIKIGFMIVLTPDATFMQSPQSLYYSIATNSVMIVLFAFSRAYNKLTRHIPNPNFMSLENQLIYWGSIATCLGGVLGAYYYYVNSHGYVADTTHRSITFVKGFDSRTQNCTIIFQMLVIIYTLLPIPIIRGSPYKEPIWRNFFLLLVIILNFILSTLIFFGTPYLSFLYLVQIDQSKEAVLYGIMMATMAVCFIYNQIIKIAVLFFEERTWQIDEQ